MAADSASSFEYEDFSSSSYDQTSESDLSAGESDASSGSGSDWSYVPVTAQKKEEQKDLYSMDHRVDFGIHGGYSGIDAMKLDTRWLDPELDWGGRIRYWLNDSLAFGVTYHRWYHDDNFPASGNYGNVKSGPGKDDFDEYGRGSFRITLNSWDASVYYFMPAGVNFKKWRVYAKGGITTWSGDYNYKHDPFAVSIYPGNENKGTSYASLSLVPGTSKIAAGIDGHDWADFVSSGHTWGFHVGGGIQYWFDPDFSIALESHYKHGHLEMDMAPDLVAGVADKEYLDLSGGYYGLTFNYHFNSPESKTQDQEDEPFPY
jgi:hypothetical protein